MAFTTRKSLLAKIKEGDEISWDEFYSAYRPLILLRGHDFDLKPTEKEDLVQIVMSEIFKGSREFLYDRGKGRFRDYIKKIINNQIARILRRRNSQEVPLCDNDFSQINVLEQAWSEEWRAHLMKMAMIELKNYVEPVTYQAFMLYGLHRKTSVEAAKFLDISVNAVYIAKNRCMELLKKIISDLEAEL